MKCLELLGVLTHFLSIVLSVDCAMVDPSHVIVHQWSEKHAHYFSVKALIAFESSSIFSGTLSKTTDIRRLCSDLS